MAQPHPSADVRPATPRALVGRGGRLLFLAGLLGLGLWRCPIALVLHLPCPGCGLTRASVRMLEGDLGGALALHPLAPVLVPALALFALLSAWAYLRTGAVGTVGARPGRAANALLIGAVVLLVGVWIARFFGAFGGPASVL